jgi:hypothetical protein
MADQFDIYAVEGASSDRGRAEPENALERVKGKMLDVYTEVAEQGGRIIGDHTLKIDSVTETGLEGNTVTTAAAQTEFLFLVAQFPERGGEEAFADAARERD